jgi:streptogramin lyase
MTMAHPARGSLASRVSGITLGSALVLATVTTGPAGAQSSTTNPYRATYGWERLPAGRTLGVVSGVIPDPDGRHLWILDRCGGNQCAGTDLDPILKLDLEGNLVDSFGAGLFAFPHGFYLDDDGFLWVTEGGSHGDDRAALGEEMGMGHQVLKLTKEGEVVMRLGEAGVWGEDESHFNGPAGVAVSPTGDIWIADGHRGGNNRLVRYASDGTFISAVGGGVGSESKEAARFSDPHDVKVDSRGRVYVADRGNSRIQVFDPNGNLLYIWTHYGKPSGLFIDRDDILYAGDGLSGMPRTGAPDPWRSNFGWEKGIRIGDLKTEQAWVVHFVPQGDEDVGAGIEFLGVDFAGNIYAGEVSRERLVRYVPFRPPLVGHGR